MIQLNNGLLRGVLFTVMMLSQVSYAEFALIQDRDGYVNIRESADLKSPVLAQLKNNTVVDCVLEQATAKFCLVSTAGLKNNGYLYKDRIHFFKDYQRVAVSSSSTDQAIYSNQDITVQFQAAPVKVDSTLFKRIGADYKYYKNKEFFGTDGSIPDEQFSQLQQMNLLYQSKKIQLNPQQLEQYFFPTQGLADQSELADFKIYYLGSEIYILNTFNQGGAAAYHVMLYFKDGKLVEQQAWKAE